MGEAVGYRRSILVRCLRHPLAPRAVIALALVLVLPSLAIGFFSDDHAMISAIEGRFPSGPPWWDLYRFTPSTPDANRAAIAAGWFPWWTAPELRLHLLRPLASALLTLDHAIFGKAPVGYHVHSLLWYAALLATVHALFRRVLPRETATLALIVYALSDANAGPAAWPSARHGTIAAVPALLGLIAHLRAREDGWRPGRWLAPTGMAIGLLGGETALGAILLAIVHDLAGPIPGTARERGRRALPMAALAISYLALYAAAGGGARASGGYVTPFTSPIEFLSAAAERFPILVGDALVGAPAELAAAGFASRLVVIGLGAMVLVAIPAMACARVATDRERGALRWAVPGGALALLTGVGAFPGARILLVANVGFAILLAVILRHGFAAGRFAMARRAGAGLLALIHVGLFPFLTLANIGMVRAMARRTERVAQEASAEAAGATRVFFANASDPMITVYAHLVLLDEGRAPIACWSWLDGAKADARITRTGPRTIEIAPIGTTFLRGAFETLYRAPSIPLHVGDEVAQCGARVRVVAMEGERPSRIEVDGAVGAPDAVVLAWQAGELRRLAIPGLGESVVVPWSAGPSGFF